MDIETGTSLGILFVNNISINSLVTFSFYFEKSVSIRPSICPYFQNNIIGIFFKSNIYVVYCNVRVQFIFWQQFNLVNFCFQIISNTIYNCQMSVLWFTAVEIYLCMGVVYRVCYDLLNIICDVILNWLHTDKRHFLW